MAESKPPYWVLISVLFSTVPLSQALATTLHEAALDLFRRDLPVGQVAGDMLQGKVVNLKKELVLGSIAGPAFEAEIETERGAGKVRFLLTRHGLELLGHGDGARRPPRELMN